MLAPWQWIFFVLHDLAALTCLTVVLSVTRSFRERGRALTIGVYCFACMLSVANIAALPVLERATDYDTAVLIFGAVALLNMILFPQIILRTRGVFLNGLICLSLNVGMEGLFSVFRFVLQGMERHAYLFYETVFCTIGYCLVTIFLLRVSKNRDLKPIRNTVDMIPKWLYAVIIICSFSSYFSVMGEEPALYDFEKVFGILHVLSVFGILLFIGYFVIQVFSLIAKQNQVLSEMNLIKLNYEQMVKSDDALRAFRHDYKNHMLIVTSLLNAGLNGEAMEYLEKVKVTSGVAQQTFSTGNFVVNAILNNKNELAGDYGIEMSFNGIVPDKGIENDDLCTVVGNLVDNAIDGARRAPEQKYIRVKGAVRNGFFTICVKNAVLEKAEIKNNRIKTTKADTKRHGIGLKNVAAVAKKYHGAAVFSCDEKEFTADVTLQLKEEPES